MVRRDTRACRGPVSYGGGANPRVRGLSQGEEPFIASAPLSMSTLTTTSSSSTAFSTVGYRFES